MEFEYDLKKSKLNKKKHGVDFEQAKTIWPQDNVVLPAITRDEPRYIIIGSINSTLFSCIFTIRQKRIRIISCRKSRIKERRIYYDNLKEK